MISDREYYEEASKYQGIRLGSGGYVPVVPHPKQKMFLDLEQREALFGGATGGGKTISLLADALKYVHVPHYSALLLRRNYPDLKQEAGLLSVAHDWLSPTDAVWHEQDKTWTFPSGATVRFGFLETERDKYRYQGGEYQFIGFDELTQFTESQYVYLFSRLRRREDVEVPLRMRGATNPGGVGGRWVYERFIPEDFSPAHASERKVWMKEGRAFVPSLLDDNPSLDREEYLESLMELDEVTRQQYISGDWLIQVRGDVLYTYSEPHTVISWSQFAAVFGERHIPRHWISSCYQDFGTSEDHPCVTTWLASAGQNAPTVGEVDLSDKVFVYRALTLTQATARDVANQIKAAMSQRGEMTRCHRWQMSHEAASERLEYNKGGIPFVNWPAGKGARTRGIEQLKHAFTLFDTDKPNPFKPKLSGCPRLLLVVDDDQLVRARDDRGLARHRAEIVAYHWAKLKTGGPAASLVPYHLFNDAVDTLRAAAADYFPLSAEKLLRERIADELERVSPQDLFEKRLTGSPESQSHFITERRLKEQEILYKLQKEESPPEPPYTGFG